MVKKTKVVARWQPLPEGASTMQVMVIPEVDELRFNPDEMTKDELKNLSQFIEQSNNTIKVENMVIERYLTRMEPNCLANMAQVLEAAAIASQKAERTTYLGGGPSNLSIQKDALGSRNTEDSSGETSRSGTIRSGSTRLPKMTLLGLSDKGPRVQAAQKIEIVNREIDELKNVLENFRQKGRDKDYLLRCRHEEIATRMKEISDAQYNFEHKLLIEGVDSITGKLSGERFIRYLEMRLRAEEIEIDKMRIKTGALKNDLKKVLKLLAQKEELGEVLHAVDFEQLQIENRECQERLEEKVIHVNRIKRVNGRYGTILNAQKKKLKEQVNALTELEQYAVVKDKLIKKFVVDEAKVNSEVKAAMRATDKISRLMKSYTVPEVMDYIKKKSELYDLKKEIKIRQRKMNIKELVLASQQQKLRSLSLAVSSKNLIFSPVQRASSIFF